MKLAPHFLFTACVVLSSLAPLKAGEPVAVTNPAAPASTEQKPAFLYFREGTFTRTGTHRITCDFKLDEPIPSSARKQKIKFYIAFDIDNDGATGTQSVTFPGFGRDISIWMIKEANQSRFTPYSGELVAKGKNHDIEIVKSKITDDSISLELKSELFGYYPTVRAYAMSSQTFYEKGMETSEIWVDQLPRHGAVTLSE